jgi:hypothetical protein
MGQLPVINTSIELPVNVITKNDKPGIEIRQSFTKQEEIEFWVRAASNEQPIIIMPRFKNKLHSLNSLLEVGILYRGNDNQLYFYTE